MTNTTLRLKPMTPFNAILLIFLLSLTLIIIPGNLSSAEITFDSFEVIPFKLKKKAPTQINNDEDLSDFNVVGTESVQDPKTNHYQAMIHGGYFFMFGFLGDRNVISMPYVTAAFKIQTIEVELGYMSMKSADSRLPYEDTSHSLPIFVSFAPEISLSKEFSVTPKIGLGGIGIMTHANYSKTYYSLLLGVKASVDVSYYLSDNMHLSIQNTFIAAQDLQESFFNKVHYYYVPGLAIHYKF